MFKFRKKKNKKVLGAQKVQKHGVHFRSKLELYCYEQLVKYNINFAYEEEKFTLLESSHNEFDLYVSRKVRGQKYKKLTKVTAKNQAMTYTPDFIVEHGGVKYIIETKGFETDSFKLKVKLFKKLLNKLVRREKIIFMIPTSQKQVDECIAIILEK